MHPGFFYHWKCASRGGAHGGEGAHASAPGGGHWRHRGEPGEHGYRASEFGVRRPLRFMAHRLDLDEEQVQVLARILNDLKTERAQRSVDEARSLNQIADALDREPFDAEAATQALALRVSAQQRLADAVLKALRDTHAMLNESQRARLVYMLRSGQLTI